MIFRRCRRTLKRTAVLLMLQKGELRDEKDH